MARAHFSQTRRPKVRARIQRLRRLAEAILGEEEDLEVGELLHAPKALQLVLRQVQAASFGVCHGVRGV